MSFWGKKSREGKKTFSRSSSRFSLSSPLLLTSVEAPDVLVPDVERAAVPVALVAVARVAIAVFLFECFFGFPVFQSRGFGSRERRG